MGTRRTEVEVESSLFHSDATSFFWVSNELLEMKSEFVSEANLDRILPLLGEEWSFRLVGVDERACSLSDEGQFADISILVPCTAFKTSVLCYLRLTPSLLHLNA